MRLVNIVLSLLLLSQLTIAQYRDNPLSQIDLSKINMEQFSFGVRITPAIAWLYTKHNDLEADGATMKIGAGIVAKYEINSILSVISGVNFNGVGGYVFDNESLNDVTTKDNYKINYLQTEIPIGIKLETPKFQKTSYFIQGGGLLGFVLEANEKRQIISANSNPIKTDIISLTSPTTVGFFGGVGLQYQISKSLQFFGDITYKNTITSIANGNEYVLKNRYTESPTILPGSLELSFGIMF